MKLHEMSADQIIEVLEKRGEAWVELEAAARILKHSHERAKTAIYNAIRANKGATVEDAKAQAFEHETVVNLFTEWSEAERQKDLAFVAYKRAQDAKDMWQTEQANRRRI